jgi:hypothetical protein
LLSEMQGGGRRITPETFAQLHLRSDDQDAYLARISAAGLPVKGFQKNVELVRSTIRRMKVQTARGATVLVPPDMYTDGALTVDELGDGMSAVTVTDHITGITGAGGPKTSA